MTEKLVSEKEFEGLSGIFIAEYEMANMTLERIVVSNPAILAILSVTKLTPEAQEEAVYLLVDRTPEWHDLDVEIQVEKIKATLTQESVIEFLKDKEAIRPNCNMVQTGIDQEGSIVIEAYYTQLNREQRRLISKSMTDEQKDGMREAVNILSGNDNIVDLAAKKLEKLKAQSRIEDGKFKAVVAPKKGK